MLVGWKAFKCLSLPSEDSSLREGFTRAGINLLITALSRAQLLLEEHASKPVEVCRSVSTGLALTITHRKTRRLIPEMINFCFPACTLPAGSYSF